MVTKKKTAAPSNTISLKIASVIPTTLPSVVFSIFSSINVILNTRPINAVIIRPYAKMHNGIFGLDTH